jgi:flagellar basal-body rod modification protein FlgD
MTTAIDPFAAASSSAASTGTSSGASVAQNDAGSADRFLKLLVTQMQNQDPLNPMDNAQLTSQMAQINTVSGISTLNTTVAGLNTQFVQMQALQGASLVGHDVTVAGDGLAIQNKIGTGAFTLAGPADHVKVEVLDTTGRVVDTMQLGAATSGTQSFSWPAGSVADGSAYRFRVTATSGSAKVDAQLLMLDRVDAVSVNGSTLMLELQRSGNVAYGAVKAFN